MRTLTTLTRELAPDAVPATPERRLRQAPAKPARAPLGDRLLGGELWQALVQRCGGDRSCGCESAPAALDMVQEVLRTPGSPLEASMREIMEERFDADFSQVRLHTDDRAAASAHAVDALAYTVGNHIVLGGGNGGTGGRLLAHELAHVLQQGQDGASASSGELRIEDPMAPAEREAAAAADAFEAGRTPEIRQRARPRVHRSIGSPAGGCGVCHGPADAGTEAHKVIQEAFKHMYPIVVAEMPLLPAPADDNGRLDLAMPVLPGLAIGEIKPANATGLLQGDVDLIWYETQIRLLGIQTTRLRLPPPTPMPFPNFAAPGCPTQMLTILPPVHGIYMYYCEPDFSVLISDPRCDCGRRRRVRVPETLPAPDPARRKERERNAPLVPVPDVGPLPIPVPARRAFDEIREWVRRVVESGEDAMESARRFVNEHPEIAELIAGLMIGAAIAIVVVTIIEDVATLGAGIADDPACAAAALALVRAAQEIMQRAPAMTPAFR